MIRSRGELGDEERGRATTQPSLIDLGSAPHADRGGGEPALTGRLKVFGDETRMTVVAAIAEGFRKGEPEKQKKAFIDYARSPKVRDTLESRNFTPPSA